MAFILWYLYITLCTGTHTHFARREVFTSLGKFSNNGSFVFCAVFYDIFQILTLSVASVSGE